MKKMVLGCAATAALLLVAAPAQDVPKLSEFLLSCSRDSSACRMKLKDYVTAAVTQKSICLPKDVSVNEGGGDILRWLRSDDTHPAAMRDEPFDDALYEAATKLFPCAPPPPPEAPPAPPTDQPAAPPPQ
ncbi:MAG: hypothetical protein P4L57_12350 [Rhizomicrobium sp.]|nr:hypothetical protein [Rhizomicrobium sp.]